MNYRLEFRKNAENFLKKQSRDQQIRILKAIEKLPDYGDIKHLSGQDGLYRLRVGDIRIIYTVEDDVLIIIILDIGNRGEIYNRLRNI